MSGIAGIIHFDGQPAELSLLTPMTEFMKHRGPDGINHWVRGNVALGHCMLQTTPESLEEKQPLSNDDESLVLVADVRLDNWEELRAELLQKGARLRTRADAELVLRAYEMWGKDCLDHIDGDFAFMIWDARRQEAFCARDRFGMRPFTYFRDEKRLVFASEPAAILTLPSENWRINEMRITDYLLDWEGDNLTSTFFEKISRLLPAHSLVCTAGSFDVSRYWDLAPQKELHLPSDAAYADAFLDVFTGGVRRRLRCVGPVGSMLSGGMDSSSVVAVASELLGKAERGPLYTFSAIGPDAQTCIETRSVHAALSVPGLKPHLIDYSKLGQLVSELIIMARNAGEPFDRHMNLPRAVYLAASHAGVKVVLDGVAGDVVLGHGTHIARLMRSGRFVQAIRDAVGEERFWGPAWPAWKNFLRSCRDAFAPPWVRALENFAKTRQSGLSLAFATLSGSLANRARVAERFREGLRERPTKLLSYGEERALCMTHPYLIVGRERYERTASAVGIEARDPFLDLRVVKFCLGLPGSQLERNGWPKFILRNALSGRLPPAVCWRKGKDHLGWKFTQVLLAASRDLVPNSQHLADYVAPSAISGAASLDNAEAAGIIFRSLSLWLDRYGR